MRRATKKNYVEGNLYLSDDSLVFISGTDIEKVKFEVISRISILQSRPRGFGVLYFSLKY